MEFKPLPFACGLAFDIEKDEITASGFKPARIDLGAGKELFADLRLEGFVALLQLGFAEKLIVFGGNEGRYKDEKPVINRAWAITQMLEYDFGIPNDRLGYFASSSNTIGNVEAIKKQIGSKRSAVVSNHYHLPRAALDLTAAGLCVPLHAAEAFILLNNRSLKELLLERLGGGLLAERSMEEIQGMADKLVGAYTSRTDATPIDSPWWKRIFA